MKQFIIICLLFVYVVVANAKMTYNFIYRNTYTLSNLKSGGNLLEKSEALTIFRRNENILFT